MAAESVINMVTRFESRVEASQRQVAWEINKNMDPLVASSHMTNTQLQQLNEVINALVTRIDRQVIAQPPRFENQNDRPVDQFLPQQVGQPKRGAQPHPMVNGPRPVAPIPPQVHPVEQGVNGHQQPRWRNHDQPNGRPPHFQPQVLPPQAANPGGQKGHNPWPNVPFQNQVPPMVMTREQLAEVIQEQYGPALKRATRPTFRHPFPDWIDRMDLPQNFRVPNFATFSGEDNQSTLEHIGRFTLKCGPLSNNDWYKMKLFSNTLTETTFKWYLNLPPNSIHTWQQMQDVFHD
ncbi:uncharacterized protein LOC132266323 [Cornus florida]|uniref:uncharacterized protein LOC132266323 n=1 Tax=Cornus florida TaxID=4283 RepID=UPI00289E6293|nr:uncharacterized protein LOC132266323 [Cornus florida]